jgi:hypothetical protein
MSPKLKGRSFWFDAEIVMYCWIETSVLSDIPAVITDFRVLVDFQTLQCMIWSWICFEGVGDWIWWLEEWFWIRCASAGSNEVSLPWVFPSPIRLYSVEVSMFFDLVSVSTLRETVESGVWVN